VFNIRIFIVLMGEREKGEGRRGETERGEWEREVINTIAIKTWTFEQKAQAGQKDFK
jgi:hypothetical protein